MMKNFFRFKKKFQLSIQKLGDFKYYILCIFLEYTVQGIFIPPTCTSILLLSRSRVQPVDGSRFCVRFRNQKPVGFANGSLGAVTFLQFCMLKG